MKIVLPNNIAEEYELKMGYKRVEILKSNDENKCNNFQDYENSEKVFRLSSEDVSHASTYVALE